MFFSPLNSPSHPGVELISIVLFLCFYFLFAFQGPLLFVSCQCFLLYFGIQISMHLCIPTLSTPLAVSLSFCWCLTYGPAVPADGNYGS